MLKNLSWSLNGIESKTPEMDVEWKETVGDLWMRMSRGATEA